MYAIAKEFDKEAGVLRELLAQTCFRRGRRGACWDRLALLWMEHGLTGPAEEISHGDDSDDDLIEIHRPELDQEACRQEALKVCWQGLEDQWTHLGTCQTAVKG